MIILKNYEVQTKNGAHYAKSKEPRKCPLCEGNMFVRDSKCRRVILSTGEELTFRLRRLKCKKCRTLHVELPDLLVPYKHYSRDAIEQALSGTLTFCPAENSTIYRWSKELRENQDL